MAGEFKIKTGLLLGPSPTQPVTSIKDTSTSITIDASSILVTGKAVYDYSSSNFYNKSYVDASLDAKQDIISFGASGEIPYTNSTSDNYSHDSNFKWNGKYLKVSDASFNVLVSNTSLSNISSAGEGNVIMGRVNFVSLGVGEWNSIFGSNNLFNATQANFNSVMGFSNLSSFQSGNFNTIIGTQNGQDLIDGSGNIFIGTETGKDELGSYKLYIDSNFSSGSDASSALIYGEFDPNGSGNGKLRINAQDVELNGISESVESKILYYNTSSNRISYGDPSSGSGGDSYWELDGSILKPIDDSVDVELSSIQVNTDAGIVTLVGMDVSSASLGTEESYSFDIDGSVVAKIWGEADGNGALQEYGFVVETAQYMGDPNTNGSWRFYPDSNGDLVFEKRVSGSWVEKGKFVD